MMLGDPAECRQRAMFCIVRASECKSPAARQRYHWLALNWIRLAVRIERQWRGLHHHVDPISFGKQPASVVVGPWYAASAFLFE